MYTATTKQLMDQSKLFRFLFWGSILLVATGVIFSIVFPFSKCAQYNYYYSCSWYYSSYSYECYTNGMAYCCQSGYGYCGSSYCMPKPFYYRPCVWMIIAGGSMMGVGFFLSIFVFVMFCNFRNKVRRGEYVGMPYLQPIYIHYPVPNGQVSQPIVYSDQN